MPSAPALPRKRRQPADDTALSPQRRKASAPAAPVATTPPAARAQGRYELAAYARHERDLALSLQPGGHPKGFRFDDAMGERVVKIIETTCVHHKGEWAGQPFLLEPWERFIVRCLFGWLRADGTRRFRESYVEVARKAGKSELAAAIGTYLLTGDQEPGAEIYATATKEQQAHIVWSAGREMVLRSPVLRRFVTVRQKQLSCPRLSSFFRPLGADSDTLDGLNPHGHICDELHAHKSRALFDILQTGMGARRQPLTFSITTAGVYNPEAIGWEKHVHAQQVLDQIVEDDEFFAIIFAIDGPVGNPGDADYSPGDAWDDPAVWGKANPNLGVSVKPDYLAKQCQTAQQQPSFLNTFYRLHLCVWTQQLTRWIAPDAWNKCATAVPSLEALRGRVAYLGLDLSTKLDIVALAVALPDGEDYDFLFRFWVPEALVAERAREKRTPDYAAWVRDGWLLQVPGNVIDYGFVRREILALREILKIRQLGFDPWNASQLMTELQGEGFSVDPKAEQEQLVEMRQGMRTLSEPSKEFEKLVVSGHMRHGGHPVMRWMVDNAVIRRDANDNIAPDKKSASGKIDGVVAAIMALGRAILAPAPTVSVYESRGLLEVG